MLTCYKVYLIIQSNLTELYTEPTYDELKEVILHQNYLNPSDDSTEESAPTNTTEES